MKQVILALSLISSFALAETATITVEGMHCSGCKQMVNKNVCENAAVKSNSESCEVKLVDEDKQIGEVTIVSKKDAKVDIEAVKAGVKAAGDDYKVTKVDVKEMVTKDLKTETAAATPEANLKAGETVTTTTTETVTKGTDGKVTKQVKMKKVKKMAKKVKEMKPATDATATKTTTTETTTETKKETK